MELFFIRHGETAYNRDHHHQPADAPLDELGKRQAMQTGAYVREFAPTQLLSSTMTRAVETATLINQTLELPLETWEELQELKRPQALIGRHYFSLRSVWYLLRWFYDRTEIYTSAKRGESRLAFLRRIREARMALEALPTEARVIVISHSLFINFFIEHICNDDPLPMWKATLIVLKLKRLDNSSISHVTCDKNAPDTTCRWTLVSFDDDSHVVT